MLFIEYNTMNLVTGATGLVGSYLVKHLLKNGEPVRALKRSTSHTALLGEFANQVEWIEGDILDITSLLEAMQGVTKVYHCAAVISFIPSEAHHMIKVNVEGTANVMNAALASQVQKVLHVSSTAAFGVAPYGKVIDEHFSDANINKSFAYYRSKQYGEREAWRASEEGLDVVIVCPSTVLGAGWWNTAPNSLFAEVYRGLKFYTTATNGFVDVRDTVVCMHRLMHSDVKAEKFIVSAENVSFQDIIWQIADELQVKRPGIEAGNFLRSVAWRAEAIKTFFTQKPPLITKESAAVAAIDFYYNNSKICHALNFNFIPVKQTIAETAAIYLQSVKSGENFGTFI